MEEPSLRALLGRRDLGLRLLSDEAELDADALDRPLRWVHSSDLDDPTPFLADELALLTTGSQFTDGDAGIGAYVARLQGRGVVGLGFGTGVHRASVPDELVGACRAAGMPLLEVPYGTPFIAVARAHAEAMAARAYARRLWALDAQRALAVAALRPRGLESTLSELARRLDRWVGLYDTTGALVHEHPRRAPDPADAAALAERAVELVTRGGEAGLSLTLGSRPYTLFTLGRRGHLRGVIALGAGALDAEARAVVTSVIAMAGLALDQSERLARARRRLHAQVLASLLADDPSLARRVLGALPRAPIVVGVADAAVPADALEDWWDRRAARGPAVFLADSDAGRVMCVPAGRAALFDEIAARFGAGVGVSEPADYDAFSRAHAQAAAALRHAGARAVRYVDTAAASVLTALTAPEARLAARTRLAPLRAHEGLERTVRVWLEHGARLDQAAAALGIHRHTLRARVAQASAALETDLSSFAARAQLWATLQAAGPAE